MPPGELDTRERIRVVVKGNLLQQGRTIHMYRPGITLAGILDDIGIPESARRYVFIALGGHRVWPSRWHVVRPKAGADVLVIERMPQGGGNGDFLRLALLAVVVVAAAVVTYGASAYFTAAGFGGYAGVLGAAAGAAVTVAGSLAVNALVPPAVPEMQKLSGFAAGTMYSLEGANNSPRQRQPLTRPVGTHKQVAPLASYVFTEVRGNNRYINVLVAWGLGPIQIADLKLGDTDMDDVPELEAVEHRYGYPNDPPLTLYPGVVFEDPQNITLVKSAPQIIATAPDTDRWSVEFALPQGLFSVGDSGKTRDSQVAMRVRYRLVGATPWTTGNTLSLDMARKKPFRRSIDGNFPARGNYELEITLTTQSSGVNTHYNVVVLTAVRAFRNQDPTPSSDHMVAKSAFRFKASGLLNGQLPPISATITALTRSYHPSTGTWDGLDPNSWQPTSQPAAWFRSVLQDHGNREPVSDELIDLATLEEWQTDWCDAHGFACNGLLEGEASLEDRLRAIAAAGLATVERRYGRYTVVWDKPQPAPVDVVTPLNTIRDSFGYRLILPRQPPGMRVEFINRDIGYATDRRLVLQDGYTDVEAEERANELETLQLGLVTDAGQAWRIGRYHLAVHKLRRFFPRWTMGPEWTLLQRGDRIAATFKALRKSVGYGRVRELQFGAAADVSAVVIDAYLDFSGGPYAMRARHAETGATEVYPLANSDTTTNVLTLAVSVPEGEAPMLGDMVTVGITGAIDHDLIIKSITPSDGDRATIEATDFAPDITDAWTGSIPAWVSPVNIDLTPFVPSIAQVRSDETVIELLDDGTLIPHLVAEIATKADRPNAFVLACEVEAQKADGSTPLTQVLDRFDHNADWTGVYAGDEYTIRARYHLRDTAGMESVGQWSQSVLHTIVGATSPPPDHTSFTMTELANGMRQFIFQLPVIPPDLRGSVIRFKAGTGTPVWDAMQALHDGYLTASPFETAEPKAPASYVFAIRAEDRTGLQSNPIYLAQPLANGGGEAVTSDPEPPAGGWETPPYTVIRRANMLDGTQIATVGFDWQPVPFAPGLGGYQLRIQPPTGTPIIEPADTDLEEVDIQTGIIYLVSFRALSGSGRQGAWSSPISVNIPFDSTVTTTYEIPPESLTAGEINAAEITIRAPGEPGYVRISGPDSSISVVDGNGTMRTKIGKLGADLDSWAIEIRDPAGNEVMGQTGRLDGLYIKALTVGELQIVNGALTNIISGSVAALSGSATSSDVDISRTLGTITTSPNGQGSVVLFLSAITAQYVGYARGISSTPNFVRVTISRNPGGVVLWRHSETEGVVQTPGSLNLFDDGTPGTVRTYNIRCEANNAGSGRDNQCNIAETNVVMMEVKK